MSQYDFGDLESPVSGTELINTHLEPFRDALHTTHAGSSRPSYVQAGMIWIDTTTNPWIVNCYDGSDDIPLGTINTSTNQFIPSNRALWAGSSGGTANALTLTPSPAVTTLAAGVVYDCLITSTNTAAAPTLNISGTGVKTIKCNIGSGKVNAPIGALQSGMLARIGYDGTDYILMNVRPYNPATAIATASTINLDSATGDYVQLTGTTTVTAITLSDGQERTCLAAAAFTLTNGASLILPTGANITTAAGDVFVVRGEPSGVVRVVGYMRADGSSLSSGATPGCLATQSSGTTLPNITWTAITFNTEAYDDNDWHSTSTNTSRITVDADGRYLAVGVFQTTDTNNGVLGAAIAVNGTRVSETNINTGGSITSGNRALHASAILDLTAGDYIEFYGYQSGGGTGSTTTSKTRLGVQQL